MDSSQGNSCSVIQYYKGTTSETNNSNSKISNSFENQNSIDEDLKKVKIKNSEDIVKEPISDQIQNHDCKKGESSIDDDLELIKASCRLDELEEKPNIDVKNSLISSTNSKLGDCNEMGIKIETGLEDIKSDVKLECLKQEIDLENVKKEDVTSTKEDCFENGSKRGKKRKLSESNEDNVSNASGEDEADEEGLESDFDDDDEEEDNKPRRRGRCKKNPDIIPSHLSSDIVLGYKILLKFLETPQFSGFHKPFKRSEDNEDCKITCLNQIKKKFEENSYKKVCEFVNDVREMLINIYESRNPVAIKKALRLEQILEQRIAQLPNYLRPQCALVLSPEEVNNSHNKIRISKGGGFVSLLLEKTEKKRYEKNREKRKLLAEERKQLKEEQDKDVQEWEKNVLLKDCEEEIKSMWELPAIGHFIHLCADILNIGEVAQFEVERMLLMPQCSDTLDLIMTALLTNSLVRAKLDRTPSMPYSIWGPLVRTRVLSWYRAWHKEGRNEQKLFEEIGIEPDFWKILGPDLNPLDYYYFHELSLYQRVWILKTLCDVDFVRKKTVHDNIRAQTLDELSPIYLGLDQQGNRYIQFKQFCGSDIRIYRQSTKLEDDMTLSELIESTEGFEHREGPITVDKVFRDIWELNEKPEVKVKKKKPAKHKVAKVYTKVVPEPAEKKNLRRSVRAQQKTYADWSESDNDDSDTDLITLKNKLTKTETLYRPFSDKEFISLSVFRLPRDKVNKPPSKKSSGGSSSYNCRKVEESCRQDGAANEKALKNDGEEKKEETKQPTGSEEDPLFTLDTKQMQDIQADFEKIFQSDDINGDEFDLQDKLNNCKLNKDSNEINFTVKNIENLKMVFKKGKMDEGTSQATPTGETGSDKPEPEENSKEKEYDALYKYNVPDYLKPDSSKFYLVVDSVEGLRQLIYKFGSHENDLEIISRSTKSKKKNNNQNNNTSCEVQLIEKLQNLLLELEPWELDFMKSHRTNKEKMYKEYMNFINRPPDFVHPNQSYWMKTYEEPAATTSSATSTTTTTTTTTASGNSSSTDKNTGKDGVTTNESTDPNLLDNSLDGLIPRKRTRTTRVQLQPENNDLDEDFDDGDDYESNESDDNWVLPTPKRKAKKETTPKALKVPKRPGARKSKASPAEKTESHMTAKEKQQNSSPEKAKKALFWGPRSSDPSEDLNWEKNRQKILEQHNSPIKKAIFKPDGVSNEKSELQSALKNYQEPETSSVIKSSLQRLAPQIPGNKKPYFSSAQLKAMENQSRKVENSETQSTQTPYVPTGILQAKLTSALPEGKTVSSENPELSFTKNKNPAKLQTYSRIKKATPNIKNIHTAKKLGSTSVSSGKIDYSSTNSDQLIEFVQQINKPIQRPLSPVLVTNQTVQTLETGQRQNTIQQPVNRVQQSQISQISQNKINTSVGSIRMQQPGQWQPKVISVQQLNQPGKVVQQVQTQTQNPIAVENQTQVQSSNQPQMQQVVRVEPPKTSSVQQVIQVPAEKLTMVITQNTPVPVSEDLYVTDGKNLIKLDGSFMQQCLQKDKAVGLNVGDKLDLKKTLLIVKPKVTPSTSVSQNQTVPPSSQNILVMNTPPTNSQTSVAPSSNSSAVISGNVNTKDRTQVVSQGEPQAVKVVQQTPTYVIQQKSPANKTSQPQIIKIITSEPMGTNQNLLLGSNNINLIQLLQPVTQTVVASDQQSKTFSTLRFVRPQNPTAAASVLRQKTTPAQGQLIVNNLVQVSGQQFDSTKQPQNTVLAGRIVSTAVPAVRMVTPAQPQSVVSSQSVNVVTGVNPQVVKVGSSAQNQQIQTQSVLVSAGPNSQIVKTAGNISSQQIRFISQQPQVQNQTFVASPGSSYQVINSRANIPPRTFRVATGAQTDQILTQQVQTQANTHVVISPSNAANQQLKTTAGAQTYTIASTANLNPQITKTANTLATQSAGLVVNAQPVQAHTVVVSANPNIQNTQTVRIAGGSQTQQIQTQTAVPSTGLSPQLVRATGALNTQSVRLVMSGPSQPVRFVPSGNVGVRLVNRNVTPGKGTVAAQIPVVAVSGQPVRFQAVAQPTEIRQTQTRFQLTPTKVKPNTAAPVTTPIVLRIENEDIGLMKERVQEPPVTLDYIHGELSVKKTSQGWKYAVKASNGKDIILTDEQIQERLKANNGIMK